MALSPAGAYMRFSARARLAESRSCSVPIDCTLAATAGAAGVVAGAAAPSAAGAGVSSLPEQAASASARATGIHRRAAAIVVTCDILLPFRRRRYVSRGSAWPGPGSGRGGWRFPTPPPATARVQSSIPPTLAYKGGPEAMTTSGVGIASSGQCSAVLPWLSALSWPPDISLSVQAMPIADRMNTQWMMVCHRTPSWVMVVQVSAPAP